MSFNWQDIDLSDDILPDASTPQAIATNTSLFADVVVKELTDSLTNSQLNKAIENCNPATLAQVIPNGEDTGKSIERAPFATLVLGALFREMLDDEPWWQNFGGKGGVARKRLGYGGVSKFLAEINSLLEFVPPNRGLKELLSDVDTKMLVLYQQLHPGKKDVRAPAEWTQAYTRACLGSLAPASK
ncbi:unnamed protein product [Phytophthora fragariaefolia]|uniref:Unnamed protein product n=1 Tax=Phytophthora fragariaefolia TaxID=1490495 RepID=A0A9W6TWM1_9STRA|nr:unnamed protein product [Phytophthora fragariaefolia]